jgi:hypothetical protein
MSLAPAAFLRYTIEKETVGRERCFPAAHEIISPLLTGVSRAARQRIQNDYAALSNSLSFFSGVWPFYPKTENRFRVL